MPSCATAKDVMLSCVTTKDLRPPPPMKTTTRVTVQIAGTSVTLISTEAIWITLAAIIYLLRSLMGLKANRSSVFSRAPRSPAEKDRHCLLHTKRLTHKMGFNITFTIPLFKVTCSPNTTLNNQPLKCV